MSDPGWPRAEPTDPSSAQPGGTGSSSSHSRFEQAGFEEIGFESDFAELAAKFAAHGGDSLPADLSAELALEIVLNEIVEQACLATGATGAAVVVEREGEMVCRASSGPTAPELGARLDVSWGLSGECLRTGRTQRCDDALADPRADAAASMRLGVRSALVLPLIGQGGVVGLFEVFSPRALAFTEHDERRLEALAGRVMKNLERAAQPFESPAVASAAEAEPIAANVHEAEAPEEYATAADAIGEDAVLGSSVADEVAAATVPDEAESLTPAPPAHRRFDFVGLGLGAVVLACALLLVMLTLQRFGGPRFRWSKGTSNRHAVGLASASPAGVATPRAAATDATTADASGSNATESSPSGGRVPAAANQPTSSLSRSQAAPAGGLLVFENGKEVFRMPPAKGQQEQPAAGARVEAEQASSLAGEEPSEKVIALSPAAAESSLIHRVEPDYPEQARERQLQGAVVLDIHIGRDGTVRETKLVSGEPLLADAATAAVRQWRFQPRMVDGAPVEMETRVTLNFRLSN